MIISEFIEELKTFNPLAEITRDDSETILLSYLDEGGRRQDQYKNGVYSEERLCRRGIVISL